MNHKTYTQAVNATENKDYAGMSERLQDSDTVRLLHALVGLATESAELLDAMKKHVFYGKSLDLLNIKEELGDVLYYHALACDVVGLTLEEAMRSNAAKLRARYGDAFSKDAALNRDINKELEAVDGNK